MKKLIIALVILYSTNVVLAQDLVKISKSIILEESLVRVFTHVSNTMNDDTWRTEVNSMDADGDFEVGTTFTEDAHIGLRKNFITKTTLRQLVANKKAFYQTTADAKYFLSSLREVEKIDQYRTRFTYTVIFDRSMSLETLGANLPASLLEFSYGIIMKNYLNNLKRYLVN